MSFLKIVRGIAVLVLGMALGCASHPARNSGAVNELEMSPRIRELIAAGKVGDPGSAVAPEFLFSPAAVEKFYSDRNYRPAWTGELQSRRLGNFVERLNELRWDGLNPEHYHAKALSEWLEPGREVTADSPTAEQAELDVLLTDAFLTAATHLARGKVIAKNVSEDWTPRTKNFDAPAALTAALTSANPAQGLSAAAPVEESYLRLREKLKTYEQLTYTNWPTLNVESPSAAIARRLALLGYLSPSTDYPENISEALRKFQKNYGLLVSGKLDAATIAELNVPVESRVEQIRVNLERFRWLPTDLGSEYLFVNVADFTLKYVRPNVSPIWMRVVVGKDSKPTPIFTKALRSITLNPAWNLPRTIAVEEVLPRLKSDAQYASRKGFKFFRSEGGKRVEVAANEVDWDAVDENSFAFEVELPPGIHNPLGNIEFIFPNKYSVYMHGSTEPGLFRRDSRAFSHGCIRLEKPFLLAEHLLADQMDAATLRKLIKDGEEKSIPLTKPLPVHISYATAWVDSDDRLNFRHDLYRWDALVAAAVEKGPETVVRAKNIAE